MEFFDRSACSGTVDIVLTVGRETMGRRRLSTEQRTAVIELDRANPEATQAEIARAVGISRRSVSRIAPRRRRHSLEIVA
jgi:CRP-like cAMP-binding protein